MCKGRIQENSYNMSQFKYYITLRKLTCPNNWRFQIRLLILIINYIIKFWKQSKSFSSGYRCSSPTEPVLSDLPKPILNSGSGFDPTHHSSRKLKPFQNVLPELFSCHPSSSILVGTTPEIFLGETTHVLFVSHCTGWKTDQRSCF